MIGTRPFRRIRVRKEQICGVCGQPIKQGEYADFVSWHSYTGFRKEYHCMSCVGTYYNTNNPEDGNP